MNYGGFLQDLDLSANLLARYAGNLYFQKECDVWYPAIPHGSMKSQHCENGLAPFSARQYTNRQKMRFFLE